MRHRLLLLICIVSVLFGCSKKESKEQKQVVSNDSDVDLVIYTPHSNDKTEFIIKEFRQRTGLKVKIVHEGTGELLEKLTEESLNEIQTADVFWGGGIESLEADKKLFAPYRSSQCGYIDERYLDSESYWSGFSLMTMVIVYNTNLVTTEKVPKAWFDLLDPFYKNRITMPDPVKSGSAYSLLNALLAAAPDATEWEQLRALKRALGDDGIASSSSSVHLSVADGSYFAGLTSEDACLSIMNMGEPVSVVYPKDGTIVVPDGVALVKDAPHEKNAKLFIDFVLGPDVQHIVVNRWYRRSVRSDIEIPAGAEPEEKIKILPYSAYDSARRRTQLIQTWRML